MPLTSTDWRTRPSSTARASPARVRDHDDRGKGQLRDDLTASFLALVDETFRSLLDEPDAHLHVCGSTRGLAFVFTRDGLEARRQAEVFGAGNQGAWDAVAASATQSR
jgi:hypothetical protein